MGHGYKNVENPWSTSSTKEINFYSDTWATLGNKKICNFSSICMYTTYKLPLVNINHKYFESGQSQMEVISVHFTIVRATKHLNCCCAYLSSCHGTASDATFHYNGYFVIEGIRACLGVPDDPMFLGISCIAVH